MGHGPCADGVDRGDAAVEVSNCCSHHRPEAPADDPAPHAPTSCDCTDCFCEGAILVDVVEAPAVSAQLVQVHVAIRVASVAGHTTPNRLRADLKGRTPVALAMRLQV